MGGNKYKKIVEENKTSKNPVLALDDKQIANLTDISDNFSQFVHLTSLVLAHNRLTKLTRG